MATTTFFPSETKRDLLLLIKRKGSVSLDDAEEETGLRRSTLREHFSHMERDGLVRRFTKRQGRGRPSLRYELAERGQALFPARDGVLLRELLKFLDEDGQPDLVERFFESFWEARLADARHRLRMEEGHGRAAQLTVLEDVLQEQGFMPEVHADEDGLVIRECNCPFSEAVRQTRLPCRLEARFFEQLFGQQATRVTYIPDGSPSCTYEFRARNEAA